MSSDGWTGDICVHREATERWLAEGTLFACVDCGAQFKTAEVPDAHQCQGRRLKGHVAAELRRLSEFVEAVREALDEADDSRAVVRIIAALGLLDGGE